MNKILLLIAVVFTIGCSKYVRYDSNNTQYLKDQNYKIEEIQFYNANRVILWDKDTRKKLKKNDGKIKTSTKFYTNLTTIDNNLQVAATPDPNNSNILHVQYDDKSKNTLKFMKLSEASEEVRDEFIKIYNLSRNIFKDELYYLIPEKIFAETIEKDIYSDAGFWGNLIKPRRKNVYCGTIQLGGKEYQMYSKRPTFLKISRKDRERYITTKKKAKGVKIKD
jgi:hypothetical protein